LDKGLPNNTVFALAQTADGYLWLGTSVGLVSFDGNRFQKHSFSEPVYQGNRGVQALVPSRSGGVWAAMDRGGVVYLNGEHTKVFTQKEGLADAQVQSVTEDGEGTLWIVYLGAAFRQIRGGEVTTPSGPERPPPGAFNAMTADKHGTLWWAASGQLWQRKHGAFSLVTNANNPISSMCAAREGGVWLADSRSHLLHCDRSGELTDSGAFSTTQAEAGVSAIYEDTGAAVWIATRSGRVIRYDGSRFESAAVLHPQIQSLLEDHDRNIWAGTQGGGLYQVCPRVVVLADTDSGLPGQVLSTLCPDGNGGLWAVTDNGKLAHQSDSKWQVVTNADWAGEFLFCAATDREGTLFLGSRERKLHRLQKGDAASGEVLPLVQSSIQVMMCSSTGDLWIGGLNFLQRLREGHLTSYNVPAEAHSIRALVEDCRGVVWAGSSRGVLLQVQGDEAKQVPIPEQGTSASIRCLMATADGSMWMGHAGLGISRIKDGHYARAGTEHGLLDDYISQMIPDDHGWLWFGSDRGIFKVRQQELEAVMDGRASRVGSILFGQEEGVPNLQAVSGRSPLAARTGDGRLWMPTRSGIATINPQPVTHVSRQLPVLLEKITLDNRVLGRYQNILPTSGEKERAALDLRGGNPELRLPPDYSRLEIEFTCLSFVGLQNMHFRYRLRGLDQDWFDPGVQRVASYPRLPHGDYKFEAQVRIGEGDWNSSGPVLSFAVLPYVWQTWWFLASMMVLGLGAAVGSARYFEKGRMQRKLARVEREHAVERERARIARDIHDELGASLTRIAMLSQSALNKAEPSNTQPPEVSRIYETARSMTNIMDEIVWAINPSNDTLESLAAYFAEFVQEFLAPTALRFHLDIPLALPRWNLSAEIRHNLFLAFKEALNNAVKHSRASEVLVALEVRNHGFTLSVRDNGRGFDVPNGNGSTGGPSGNGLTNMRLRLEELHGRCLITSEHGRGTRVAFELELPA
jgi:signal transduction histidine kinase/ligand-binding sensor domain-containing protein